MSPGSPHGTAAAFSERLYLLVARRDVAWFRFFLEAQDNLALFSCLGQRGGLGGQQRAGEALSALCLRFAPGARPQVLAWLAALRQELPLTLLPTPSD